MKENFIWWLQNLMLKKYVEDNGFDMAEILLGIECSNAMDSMAVNLKLKVRLAASQTIQLVWGYG